MAVDLNRAIDAVRIAFPIVPYPGEVEVFGHPFSRTFDEEVIAFYRGKCWQDIYFDDMNAHNIDPHELPESAFNYYLPALLLNSLTSLLKKTDDPDTFNCMLMYTLEPGGDYPEIFGGRVEGLTLPQRNAVYLWLQVIADDFGEEGPTSEQMAYWREQAGVDGDG